MKQLKGVLNRKKRIFFTGTEAEIKEVKREVRWAIQHAKLHYKNKVEKSFVQGNLHSEWQGLKTMAAVNSIPNSRKPIQVSGSSITSLPNEPQLFHY